MTVNYCAEAVRDNVRRIREQMAAACREAGRPEDAVRLMAVTKTVDAERINTALGEGIDLIGENRVQEFLGKRDALQLDGVECHLIGHLQTNKVRQIVGKVDMIQSVDSLRLAEAIDKASAAQDIVTQVLVEVNIGGEASKSGVAADGLDELLGQIAEMRHIRVKGLMTIPPVCEKEAQRRQFFSEMYRLYVDRRAKKVDNIDMDILSMGMSADFREAILEGATLVRVGSAMFGDRIYA